MTYDLHLSREAVWALLGAIVIAIGDAIVSTDIAVVVDDPLPWLVAVAAVALRALVGAALPGTNSLR